MKLSLLLINLILLTFSSSFLQAHEDYAAVTLAQFNQIDTNGDGYLSKDEIEMYTEISQGLSVSEYGGFELADVNADGQLGKAEFAAFEEDLPVE